MMEEENITVENICGDTKLGKYEDIYVKEFDDYKEQLVAMPNFSIGEIQANTKDEYEKTYSGENEKVRRTLIIYMPEKKYEEKDYSELVHNKRRDNLTQKILEQTKGKMQPEKIREIANRLADKIEPDKEIIITTSPYEHAEYMSQQYNGECGYEIENIELEGDMKPNCDFSLNILQARKVVTGAWSNEGQRMYCMEQYYMYIPNENYLEGATFGDLYELDYKLEQARDLIDRYSRIYYQTHPEESRKKEAEEQYSQAMKAKKRILENREEI